MNTRRISWIHLLAVILLFFATPLQAAAEECEENPRAKMRIARERRARQAQRLISRLDLTRAQSRKIVALADEAAVLHLAAYESEAQLLPLMIDTFSQFAAEDRLNQGFSEDVERRTVRLHHRAKRVREQFTEKIIELEEQTKKLLKKTQRDLLTTRPRKARDDRPERNDARSRARAAAREREMERRRPLRDAREELRALHRQKHPSAGPVGKYLLHPEGAAELCKQANIEMPSDLAHAVAVLRDGTADFPIDETERQKIELRELRDEINNWNLINGLHLTEDQIGQITELYDEAVKPDWEIKPRDRRSGVARDAVYTLELKIEEALNTGQRRVLAEFSPCLIPPKNLKDPVLVGQAGDNSRYERWLERARETSNKRLDSIINASLDREAEHHGVLDKKARRERFVALRKAVRRASAMSDAEFEMNKAELAEAIAPPDRIQHAKDKVADLSRRLKETGVVAHFMITPGFVDQLRVRGEQLARGVDSERVDLAKAPQAENCEKGCAVNPVKNADSWPKKHELRSKSD